VTGGHVPRQRIGVSGHQELADAAVELIRSKLDLWFPTAVETTVICSLARGADTLVAEQLMGRGAQLHVIVPSHGYLDTFEGAAAQGKYQDLLSRAESVEVLDFDEPSEAAFMAAGSRVARFCDRLIAVWDGRPASGLGGTGDVVALARRLGRPVQVVWPEGLVR
jgi:hypothetical protein